MATDASSHARRFLATVDPDLHMVEAYRSYRQSAARKATDSDAHAWCLARINQLCGATSFTKAFEQHEVVTLLAVGSIDSTRRSDWSSLRIRQSMPVPAAMSRIEPDFFPVLLKEVTARTATSPAFSANLESAKQWLWQTAASLKAEAQLHQPDQPAIGTIAAAAPSTGEALEGLLAFIVIATVVRWVQKSD
jgi:hypothetical protein